MTYSYQVIIQLTRFAYQIFFSASLPLILLWFYWRSLNEKGYRKNILERLGYISVHPSVHGGLWIHAASVGEAKVAFSILHLLEKEWGTDCIVWTTQTPAARDYLKGLLSTAQPVFFAPLDTRWSTRNFLSSCQPRTLLLVERELWPEWLWQSKQYCMDVILVNARMNRTSIKWPYTSRFFTHIIRSIDLILSIDEINTHNFKKIGVQKDKIKTIGNLKFLLNQSVNKENDPLRNAQNKFIVIAASTHLEDEDAIFSQWRQYTKKIPNLLVVIAPRKPQRFNAVQKRISNELNLEEGYEFLVRSKGKEVNHETKILLVDTIGELKNFFKSAHIALIGGTWSRIGGHNALEPLIEGCPILFGPHTFQFPQLFSDIESANAGLRINENLLWEKIEFLYKNKKLLDQFEHAGKVFIEKNQGISLKAVAYMRKLRQWPQRPLEPVKTSVDHYSLIWRSAINASSGLDFFTSPETSVSFLDSPINGGRNPVRLFQKNGITAVVRHYYRGGLIAKIVRDRYFSSTANKSRPMSEFSLLRTMHSLDLPIPKPLAANLFQLSPKIAGIFIYQGDIAIEQIPKAETLLDSLLKRKPSAEEWKKIGATVARFHQYHIYHSDLNCENIMIDNAGKIWLIDFDKCQFTKSNKKLRSNLSRLNRSLKKQARIHPQLNWNPQEWGLFLDGYTLRSNTI